MQIRLLQDPFKNADKNIYAFYLWNNENYFHYKTEVFKLENLSELFDQLRSQKKYMDGIIEIHKGLLKQMEFFVL